VGGVAIGGEEIVREYYWMLLRLAQSRAHAPAHRGAYWETATGRNQLRGVAEGFTKPNYSRAFEKIVAIRSGFWVHGRLGEGAGFIRKHVTEPKRSTETTKTALCPRRIEWLQYFER